MKVRAMWVVFVLGLLVISPPAFAQEQSGSIEGIIKDSSGGVLPGVTVEARSPLLVGVSSVVTDAKGVYRFPALPPGTYTLTATLEGFAPLKREAVLSLGQLLKVDLTLSVGSLSETVQVVAESPLIDVKQNASFANIQQDVIERIPKGRDFTSVVKTAPGAQDESKSGGLQIDGASGSENRFIVDGMDTTNGQNGLSGKTVLIDFIQEVQVKSSGYNAEFGGSTGGVINAITKSGSNAVRGSGGIYFQSTGLGGVARDDIGRGPGRTYGRYSPDVTTKAERNLELPDRDWVFYSPVADIGGPVVKDRLWYYTGVAYNRNIYERDAIFYADPAKAKRHFKWWDWTTHANLTVTTQLSNSVRVRLSASDQRDRTRGSSPTMEPINAAFPNGTSTTGYTRSTFDSDPAKFSDRWDKVGSDTLNDIVSGNIDWVVTSRFFLNATAGWFRTNTWSPESFRGDQIARTFGFSNSDTNMRAYATQLGRTPLLVPSALQQAANYVDNKSSTGTVRDINGRFFLNGNLISYRSFLGEHVIKAGFRFERFWNDVYTGFTKPNITLNWGQSYQATDGRVFSGAYGYYILSQRSTLGAVHSNNYSVWLQDSWTLGRKLTINAGARAEREVVPYYQKSAVMGEGFEWGFDEKIAPRIGFAYDIFGNGKWKTYGSYGLFYDIMKLSLPRSQWGATHWINYYWTLDTADWPSIGCGEGTTGCPGTFIEQREMRPGSNQASKALSAYFGREMTGIDPAMKPTRTGEAVLGADHELGKTMSIGVRYVHKWLDRTIEDVGILAPGVGELFINGNPGEGQAKVMTPRFPQYPSPKAVRDYDSFEVRLKRRLANRWSGELSYTYSRLWGNFGGLASSDEPNAQGVGRTDPNHTRQFDSNYMNYDRNLDQVFGLLATDRPHVIKAQGTYDLPWGTTLGFYEILQSGTPQSSTISYQGYPVFFNGRADLGRTPFFSQLDLSLAHDFKMFGKQRLTLLANVSNVFNQKTVIGWYSTAPWRNSVTFSDQDGTFFGGPWDPAQWVALRRSQWATILDEQMFKEPFSYQGRRDIRFQVKYSW